MSRHGSSHGVSLRVSLALVLTAGAIGPRASAEGEKPKTFIEQADAVVAAAKAKDAKTLATLESQLDPDAWSVVEELCSRGELDAAEAFAKAAPRIDVERLPAYVAWRRAHPMDSKAYPLVSKTLLEQKATEDDAAALSAVEGLELAADDVTTIELALVRGLALARLGRLGESLPHFTDAAERAERIGFLSRAALGWRNAAMCPWLKNDSRAARRETQLQGLASRGGVALLDEQSRS